VVFFSISVQVPSASVIVDGRPALNQCRWHQGGHHISVGDNTGHVHVFEVGEVRVGYSGLGK
jgi:dynein intermediate chain